MVLGRGYIPQGAVKPAVVIVIHEFKDCHVGLSEAVELVPAEAFIFQYRVKGFDVGVFVRSPYWYAFMLQSESLACCLEAMAHELRSVIRADNHGSIASLSSSALAGPLNACSGFLGRATEPNVIVEHHAIVHIYHRLYEEEATFFGNVTILDVSLPQLVDTCDFPVRGYLAFRKARPQSTLSLQNP